MKASQHKVLTLKAKDGLLLEGFQWGELDAKRGICLCLHGLSSHALWFDDLAAALTQNEYCVIAVNRRGSGTSEGEPMCARSLTVLLDDLDQWMNTINNTLSVRCIGHCWGAMLARKWQEQRNPNLVECICIAPPYSTVFDKKWHPWIIKIAALLLPNKKIKLPYGTEVFSKNKDVIAKIEKDKLFQHDVSLGLLKIGNELKIVNKDFRQTNCRLILAEGDQLLENWWSELDDVSIVENAGHGLILENAESLVNLILKAHNQGHGVAGDSHSMM